VGVILVTPLSAVAGGRVLSGRRGVFPQPGVSAGEDTRIVRCRMRGQSAGRARRATGRCRVDEGVAWRRCLTGRVFRPPSEARAAAGGASTPAELVLILYSSEKGASGLSRFSCFFGARPGVCHGRTGKQRTRAGNAARGAIAPRRLRGTAPAG